MMAGIPAVRVWLGEESAIDATPTWFEVTSALRVDKGVTVNRGRSYGAGAQPGTATLTLENTDSRFTIGNASSALYPYVHLQSLIKLERDGRPWFIGRIQAMPLSWPAGGDNQCLVTLTLADRLARFERMSLGSYPVEETKALSPAAYYPLAEATGAIRAQNAAATPWGPLSMARYGAGDGVVAFGSGAGPAGDSSPAAVFTPGVSGTGLKSPDAAPFNVAASGGYSISIAFSATSPGTISRTTLNGGVPYGGSFSYLQNLGRVDIVLTNSVAGGTSPGLEIDIYAAAADTTVNGFFYYISASVMDGATHVLTIVANSAVSATALVVYLDGVVQTRYLGGSSGYPVWLATSASLELGTFPATYMWDRPPFRGTLSHAAIWARALSSAEAVSISSMLLGTTIPARAALLKILGWRGQSATALIDNGVTDSLPTRVLGGKTLATAIADINASEGGTLYVDAQDRLTWRNRAALLSPSITLTSDDLDPATTYNCDMQGIITVVTATGSGSTVIVRAADIATIGEISGSVSSMSTIADDAIAHASWIANTGPRIGYIGSLKIDLATATSTAYAAAITAGILTKIVLTGMPTQTPLSATTLEITGEAESISLTSWDLTWTTLPAGPGSARDVFILGDAVYGVLGSTHRLSY